ncbi:MAG TPA: response regulator [Herpetosiphonaceae bacterium]
MAPISKAYVLVVEDNADNMWIITEMLNDDTRVRYCNVRPSGKQLFAFMAKEDVPPINLILLDLNLPGEDGYSILKKIREHPKLQDVTVIAVTADNTAEDVAKARGAGFDGFIGKPLRHDRFPDQLKKVMEGEPVWEPF